MASESGETQDKAVRRYGAPGGPSSPPRAGTPPRPRPPGSAPTSACPTGCSARRSAPSPAASAAASSWPGSCSPTPRRRGILLLDEPTNHLDADSITWLRDFLKGYHGGLIVISHDVELLEAVVNKVFYLDANRAELDVVQPGLEGLPGAARDRRAAPQARAGQRREEGRALMAQADKMRAKATKTVAAQNMARRAEKLLSGLEATRAPDKVAKVRFPKPAPCGKTPLTAERPVASRTARWRSSPTSTWRSTGAPGSSSSASTAPARPPCCGCSAGCRQPGHRRGRRRARAAARLLRPGARDPRRGPHGPGEHAVGRARPDRHRRAQDARLVPVLRRRRRQAGRGALRRREDPARAGAARGLVRRTCCCSTSRRTTSTRSAASRSSTRCGPTRARSCWSPTTRARSQALKPDARSCCCPTASRTCERRLPRPGRTRLSEGGSPRAILRA